MDVQTTGMYYIHHPLTLDAYRLRDVSVSLEVEISLPCAEGHMERRKEQGISSETNIVFGAWMRV